MPHLVVSRIESKEDTPCNIVTSLQNTLNLQKGEIHSLALKVKKEKKETLYFSNIKRKWLVKELIISLRIIVAWNWLSYLQILLSFTELWWCCDFFTSHYFIILLNLNIFCFFDAYHPRYLVFLHFTIILFASLLINSFSILLGDELWLELFTHTFLNHLSVCNPLHLNIYLHLIL
jgi:hypothetical protein